MIHESESESAQEKIRRILTKPGKVWSPEEKRCVIDWLLPEDPYALSICATRFFRHERPTLPLEEARDAFSSFIGGGGLDRALAAYDPTKGQLGAYLRSQLTYHCKSCAAQVWRRQRVEVAAPQSQWEDGEEVHGGWLEQVPDSSSESNPVHSLELRNDIQEALGKLPKQYRRTLLLFLRGNNYNEISRELGVSLAVVKNRLCHSRQRLRRELTHLRPRSGT